MIDRGGKHFSTVLNYLRDGSVPLPESQIECEELLVEARWEGMRGGERREVRRLE